MPRKTLTGVDHRGRVYCAPALQLMVTCRANVSQSVWLAQMNCSQRNSQSLVSLVRPTLRFS